MRPIALTVLRVVALVILCTGMIAAATAAHPSVASHEDFRRDLERGAVTRVIVPANEWTQDTVRSATWSTGPFEWRTGTVVDTPPWSASERSSELASGTTAASPWSDFANEMWARDVELERAEDDPPFIGWPFRSPEWFGLLLAFTWIATFLTMLVSTPRWGNRWAWFWMFVIGEIGVILYLIVEPEPLVRIRRHRDAAGPQGTPAARGDPGPPRRDGTQACLVSILAAIVAAAASAGIGWLAGLLLR